jgi:subtilisin family serine protease
VGTVSLSRIAASARKRGFHALLICIASTILASTTAGGAQESQTPQTGGARQLWPQRPGAARAIELQLPPVAEPQPEYAPNQVMVQFRAGVSDAERAAVRASVAASASQDLRDPGGRLELLTTPLAVPDAVQILQASPQIEFAEPDWIVRSEASANDPSYVDGNLWGMYGGSTSPANQFGSDAGRLWERGFTGSSSVYVGVIDSGIDINHPDLAPNIWANPFDPVDGIDNDGNGYIDDVHGWDFLGQNNSVYDGSASNLNIDAHGTHVAGTIGARGRNSVGVAGLNWSVTLIPMKFLNASGSGFTSDAVLAVNYLIDLKQRHGLNVVAANNSWSVAYSITLHEAFIRAAKANILMVAAAGNNASNNDVTPRYPAGFDTTQTPMGGSELPANFDAVISVAALTALGDIAPSSNYGATSVDIGAPGAGILSTGPQNGYRLMTGTSMATAHVTGAAAMYKSMNHTATAEAIRDAILSHGIFTPGLNGRTVAARRLSVGDFSGARMTFTDTPLVPGMHMRAVHVAELRTRINDLRVQHGLPTATWTDAALGRTVIIRAVHLAELRAAINELYVALGQMPMPVYTDSPLLPRGTVIKAVHISELRAAIEALED